MIEQFQDPRGVPNMCKVWAAPNFQVTFGCAISKMYHEADDLLPDGFRQKQRLLKEKFGRKHDHFYEYNEINLGWTSEDGGWRASISNRGFAFYVNKNYDYEQAKSAFEDFMKVIQKP